jgi:hypothetical protein
VEWFLGREAYVPLDQMRTKLPQPATANADSPDSDCREIRNTKIRSIQENVHWLGRYRIHNDPESREILYAQRVKAIRASLTV